jgi:hypothetical protein
MCRDVNNVLRNFGVKDGEARVQLPFFPKCPVHGEIMKCACFSKHKSRFFKTYIHPCRSHYLEDRVVISISATTLDGNCLLAMICSIKFSTNELMV